MPRDKEPARRRLIEAALELFTEHGFDAVTAAQIAARADVTERTFFRHFSDKREVLFDGQVALSAALTAAIREAPLSPGPIAMIQTALASVADRLDANRGFSEPRQAIIAATPALRERETAKHAALTQSVADALRGRGIESRRADLAARTGLAVLSYALAAWLAAPGSGLAGHLDQAFAELRDLSAPT